MYEVELMDFPGKMLKKHVEQLRRREEEFDLADSFLEAQEAPNPQGDPAAPLEDQQDSGTRRYPTRVRRPPDRYW